MDTFTVKETPGGTMATVTIVRNGDTSGEVGVHFETRDFAADPADDTLDNATAGKDYQTVSTDVNFAAGETSKPVMIPIPDDDETEFTEQVRLILSNPTGGAQLGARSEAVVLIKDDEPPEVGFVPNLNFFAPFSVLTVHENGGNVDAFVYRRGDLDVTVSVDYRRKVGSANDNNVESISGTLDFTAGVAKLPITITPIPDSIQGGDLYFFVILKNPVPPDLRPLITTLQVTIRDDNPPATPPKSATATDSDGDVVTGSLKGNGSVQIVPATPSGSLSAQSASIAAASGTAFDIILSGTDAATTLNVKVGKGAAGDGLVNINSIVSGGGLKSISAKAADLTGDGIFLDGPLGKLTIHDILNGADIITGGTTAQSSAIKARVIGDDTIIALGTAIKSFAAASIGQSGIFAPSIGKLSVAGNMTNAHVFVGFAPDDTDDPLAGGTFAPGALLKSVGVKGTFANSIIAATQIGKVSLATVQTNNNGVAFGIFAPTIGGVTVKSPPFKWNPTGSADQSIDDFHVIRP
jgi:hypothetical protein